MEGTFTPWFETTRHPLQPTGNPHEVWAAIPAEGGTEVGRYDTRDFKFTAIRTFPGLRFTSAMMWVDAPGKAIYLATKGDLLSLPLAP